MMLLEITDFKNLWLPKGKGCGGGIDWETGVKKCKLLLLLLLLSRFSRVQLCAIP